MATTISLVQYLNSAPLGWGLTHGPGAKTWEVLLSTPAECADQVKQGVAQAGLIPVVEFARIPGLSIVPNISIATMGRARSVLLVSRVELARIGSVALDNSSRTSAILLQLLLSRLLDKEPLYETCPPDISTMLSGRDAALIIGDYALKLVRHGLFVYDLGELWVRHTGLPFVFAFWALRPSEESNRLAGVFAESRRYGLDHLDEICLKYSERLSLTPADIREYLTVNIDFDLGPSHVKGLNLFFEWSARQGLLSWPPPLQFIHS